MDALIITSDELRDLLGQVKDTLAENRQLREQEARRRSTKWLRLDEALELAGVKDAKTLRSLPIAIRYDPDRPKLTLYLRADIEAYNEKHTRAVAQLHSFKKIKP